jgi:rhodanese-related sulfurtransferase
MLSLKIIERETSKHSLLNIITAETLVDLLIHQDDIIVIDCRFDYEYEGGHI